MTLLERHHRELGELFEMHDETTRSRKRIKLFNQIARVVAAHMTIEEEIFYPAVFAGELGVRLAEATREHSALTRIIGELVDQRKADETFVSKMRVLQGLTEHHMQEEEDVLFPWVTLRFTDAELESLGDRMEAAYDELMQRAPRRLIPDQTGGAATIS